MTGKLTRKPGGKAAPSVDEFIAEAGQDAASANVVLYNTRKYSWEDPRVRDDVLKIYNLRLPEPYLMKLKYIAENTPYSMQKFCLDTLLPAIDIQIEKLTGKR